jgi:AbrB family looped-hinge helix DNA binding protein
MKPTITMDAAGRIVLPKPIRERLHLRGGAKLRAHIVADKIELIPEEDENVRIVRKGKRLVITGVPSPFEAVASIKADRRERDELIARRLHQK